MKNVSFKRLFWPTLLIFLATLIGLPTANGAIHPADPIILMVSILLPTPYALIAAGIGSFAADIIKGFYTLAPATLILKLLMVLAVKGLLKLKPAQKYPELITAPALLLPIPGYYLAKVIELLIGNIGSQVESTGRGLYSFAEAAITLKKDLVQATAGILIFFILYHLVTSFIAFRKSLKEQKEKEEEEQE